LINVGWKRLFVELSVGRNTAVFMRAAESLPCLFRFEETEDYPGGWQNI